MISLLLLILALSHSLLIAGLKINVLVTGAAGRTGKLVFEKLLASEEYNPVGIVRTPQSAKKLLKSFPAASEENVVYATIADKGLLESAIKNSKASKLILCTSATPKLQKRSLFKILFKKFVLFSKNPGRPSFTFPNGSPYQVDYLGALNTFDAVMNTKSIDHVVVVSSMGGTQPENFLNSIGKIDSDDKSGNILLWKRDAERKLISLCNASMNTNKPVKYTIIHPGGLTDKKGGEKQIVFGVDDKLLQEKVRSIPRQDVAEVCVQSLSVESAWNRSFDIIAREGPVTSDWKEWFQGGGDCDYSL